MKPTSPYSSCPHCHSGQPVILPKPTTLGYCQFRWEDCQRPFNERTGPPFNRLQVPTDGALLAVRWYLRYKLNLRDLEEVLLERGFEVSYETIRGWVHDFGSLIAGELRKRRSGKSGRKWPVDETSVKINGKGWSLWRAIDGDGNLVDVPLSEERDRAGSDAFLAKAKGTAERLPERVVSDGWQGYPNALKEVVSASVKHECTKGGETWQYATNRLDRTIAASRGGCG